MNVIMFCLVILYMYICCHDISNKLNLSENLGSLLYCNFLDFLDILNVGFNRSQLQLQANSFCHRVMPSNEPRCEKTGLQGF